MAWLTCSISTQYCQAQVPMCSSMSDTRLEMDNQISSFVVAEDAAHIVGGGSHMLFPVMQRQG